MNYDTRPKRLRRHLQNSQARPQFGGLVSKPILSPALHNTRRTYSIHGHRYLSDLLAAFGTTLQTKDIRKWHLVHPARGYLQGIGNVVILATDGLLALFYDGSNTLLDGHKEWFFGPVSRHYIDEEDWDFDENKQRVNVFRRNDGTFAILPTDWVMKDYWETRKKYGFDKMGALEPKKVREKKPPTETKTKKREDTLLSLAFSGLD